MVLALILIVYLQSESARKFRAEQRLKTTRPLFASWKVRITFSWLKTNFNQTLKQLLHSRFCFEKKNIFLRNCKPFSGTNCTRLEMLSIPSVRTLRPS